MPVRAAGGRGGGSVGIAQEQPGITIPELVKRMGVKQNYLYHRLPGLESEGKIKKQGRG